MRKSDAYRASPYIFTYITTSERVPLEQQCSTRMGVSGASYGSNRENRISVSGEEDAVRGGKKYGVSLEVVSKGALLD